MRITGLHVGGFGLLTELAVGGLGAGITVVVGPNEAGKSHLHAFFVRTLFGHPRANDARGRDRHEPLRGGRHGGVVSALDRDGAAWEIHRYTTGSPVLRVVQPDGTESTKADALVDLTGRGIDAERYEQVFAIDLDALADLGSLQGDALDELLLDAGTVGAGRSLRRAITELQKRRDEVWTPRSQKPPLNAAQRARREAEKRLREAQERAGSYRDALDEVARLQGELDRVRGEQDEVRAGIRRLERLKELWPTWQQLAGADERLSAAGATVVPDGLAGQVEDLHRERGEAATKAEEARGEADRLEAEAEAVTVEDGLAEVAERVAAHARGLGLQGDRRGRLEQATAQARDAEQAARAATGALPDGWDADRVLATPADPTLPAAVRGAVDRLRTAEQDLEAATDTVDAATRRLAAARQAASTSADAVGDAPPVDVQDRRAAVGALRSALPDLERIEAGTAPAAGHRRWIPVVAAILTAVLVLTAGVAVATGALGVGVAALVAAGLAGLVTAGVWRTTTGAAAATSEAATVPDLRAQVVEAGRTLGLSPPITRRDVESADLQTEDLAEERRGWEQRRAAAQRDAAAVQHEEAALGQAEADRSEHQRAADAARAEWRDVAERAGLDPGTDPAGAPELLTAIGEARRALQAAEAAERTRAHLADDVAAFDATTAELCAAVGRDVGDNPDADLARLADDCAADTTARAERTRLLREAEQQRRAAEGHDERVRQLDAELQAAYEQVGVTDAEGFAAAVAADVARREAQADRDRADGTLRQHLGDDEQAQRLRAELATGRVTVWQDELADLQGRIEALEEERDALVREHTTAEHELQAIGEDDAVVTAAGEVEQLTERCRELAEQWARADLAARLLSTTLERFEDAHQPAVLEETGALLAQATAGRWTDVRRIDDELYVASDGDPVPAQALSRGATEQLYLCLRLALADELNQDGARLPLLIDDLMANADPERADGLARILADVATRRQVIVFTCNQATAERVVDADPTAGVLGLSPAGTGAAWQRRPATAEA